jgi:hypothetical protein
MLPSSPMAMPRSRSVRTIDSSVTAKGANWVQPWRHIPIITSREASL